MNTVPDYPYPCPVALVTLTHRGRSAWAVVSENTVVATGTGTDKSTEEEAALAGFEVILTNPSFVGQPVDLYTNNRGLRTALIENRRIASHVEPIPHVSVHDPRMEQATVAAKAAAEAAGPVALHAGTDGARERHASVGGYGWITSEGEHGYGGVAATSPVEAEIVAIAKLLDATDVTRPLVVHIDSKHAIALCNKALAGEDTEARFKAVHDALAPIRRHKGRDVSLEHMKGHAGNALNEGAHRLAVLARRIEKMDIGAGEVDTVVANIVAETLAEV